MNFIQQLQKRIGFIAQNINIPELKYNNETNYTANIFCNGVYELETKIITSEKVINSIFSIGDIVKIITDSNDKQFNIHEYDNRYKRMYCKLIRGLMHDTFGFDFGLVRGPRAYSVKENTNPKLKPYRKNL